MSNIDITTDFPEAKADVKILNEKPKAKAALQKERGWPVEPKRPMICIPTGMTKSLGGKLFEQLLPGLLSLEIEILILGKGSSSYGSFITGLAEEQNHRFHIVPSKAAAVENMVKAADMALFLSDPTEFAELSECLAHGTVPIAPDTRALQDYNPVQETGNSFLYRENGVWQCFAAIVRACETYIFPFDWKTIQRHCLER